MPPNIEGGLKKEADELIEKGDIEGLKKLGDDLELADVGEKALEELKVKVQEAIEGLQSKATEIGTTTPGEVQQVESLGGSSAVVAEKTADVDTRIEAREASAEAEVAEVQNVPEASSEQKNEIQESKESEGNELTKLKNENLVLDQENLPKAKEFLNSATEDELEKVYDMYVTDGYRELGEENKKRDRPEKLIVVENLIKKLPSLYSSGLMGLVKTLSDIRGGDRTLVNELNEVYQKINQNKQEIRGVSEKMIDEKIKKKLTDYLIETKGNPEQSKLKNLLGSDVQELEGAGVDKGQIAEAMPRYSRDIDWNKHK